MKNAKIWTVYKDQDGNRYTTMMHRRNDARGGFVFYCLKNDEPGLHPILSEYIECRFEEVGPVESVTVKTKEPANDPR